MTDLLTDEVNDTGEIRHEPGQKTTNLTYITQGPALRRPDATFEIPVIDAEPFQSDTPRRTQPNPDPLPPPPPPTPVVDDRPLSDGEEIVWDAVSAPDAYVGRHRAADDMPATVHAGRFGVLRSVLASAWTRVRRSM